MKRAFLALGLLALLAAPASAGGIGMHAGWLDTDQAGDDAGFGLLFNFDVATRVQIQLRGTDFRELTINASDANTENDFKFQATLLDLGFIYRFTKDTRKFTPYVGGGGTYYFLDSTPDSTGRLNDEYGWYGIVGLDLPIHRRWSIYVEGMWRDAKMTIKGDDLGLGGPVDVGINLNGPQANAGIAFSW